MFELTGLGRIKGTGAPSLLVPLFGVRTSNHTFIHELGRSFLVQRFRRCDMDYFDVLPYATRRNFAEGGAGLIAFEWEPGQFFLGSYSELKAWWSRNRHTAPEGGLLHAILTEIATDDPTEKYSAWQAYFNHNFKDMESTSEAAEAKIAQIQRWKGLWDEIEADHQSSKDDDQKFLEWILKQSASKIINWLKDTSNFEYDIWRVVWQYADRQLLSTEESRAIIFEYLEYCVTEEPLALEGDLSYLVKRAMSSEVLPLSQREIELSRQCLRLGVALLSRSRISPGDLDRYCRQLYVNNPHALTNFLLDMISRVTGVYDYTTFEGAVEIVNFRALESALTIMLEVGSENYFTKEDVFSLADFFIGATWSQARADGLKHCVHLFNELVRPFGIDSSVIRNSHYAEDPGEYVRERITMIGTK